MTFVGFGVMAVSEQETDDGDFPFVEATRRAGRYTNGPEIGAVAMISADGLQARVVSRDGVATGVFADGLENEVDLYVQQGIVADARRGGALESRLVTVHDMPAGWQMVLPGIDEPIVYPAGTSQCERGFAPVYVAGPNGSLPARVSGPAYAREIKEIAAAEFDSGDRHASRGNGTSGYVSHSLYRYDSAADANKQLTAFADYVKRCRTRTEEGGEGYAGGVESWSPLSFPNLGDATFAARVSYDGTFDSTADRVLVQKGNLVTAIYHRATQGEPDSARTRALVEKSVAEV